MTPAERFWAKVKKTPTCWLWTAATAINGRGQENLRYGKFGLRAGKTVQAHRFSYELATGEILGTDKCCHTCDNTICVNPKHLFRGDNRANMADCVAKGRTSCGERRYNAKLTNEKAREIRDYPVVLRDPVHGITPLAKRMGVAASTVSWIRRGKLWATALR